MATELNETSYRIMEVALQLFSEQGYYSTTTKQIAQAADVNELTIFRHFGSKANLFQSTTEEYVTKSHTEQVLLEGVDKLSTEEIINAIAERIYDLYKKNTKLYKVQLKLSDHEVDFVRLKLSRKIKSILNSYFAELVSENKLSGRPELMSLMLINSLLGQLTIGIVAEDLFDGISETEMIREVAQQFVSSYKVD